MPDVRANVYWPQLPWGHVNCVQRGPFPQDTPDTLFQRDFNNPPSSPTTAQYNVQVPKTGNIIGVRQFWRGNGNGRFDLSIKNVETAVTEAAIGLSTPSARDIYRYIFDDNDLLAVTRGDVLEITLDFSSYSGEGGQAFPEEWGTIPTFSTGTATPVGELSFPSRSPAIDFIYEDDVINSHLGHCMLRDWEDTFAQASVDAIGNKISFPFDGIRVKGVYANVSWIDNPTVIKLEDATTNAILQTMTVVPPDDTLSSRPHTNYETALHKLRFEDQSFLDLVKGQVVRVYAEQTGGTNIFASRLQFVDLQSHVAFGSGRYAQGGIRTNGTWQFIRNERFLMGLWLEQITVNA